MLKPKVLLVFICLVSLSVFSQCTQQNQSSDVEQTYINIVKTIHAEIVKGNFDVFDEYLDSNYVRHCQAMPPELQEMHGVEKLKGFVKEFIESVTNYSDSVGPIFANNNMVAYVSTMKATNSGSMNGLPPSGNNFTVVNLVMHRFENNKIVETWVTWDNVAVLSQLGFFPPPSEKP